VAIIAAISVCSFGYAWHPRHCFAPNETWVFLNMAVTMGFMGFSFYSTVDAVLTAEFQGTIKRRLIVCHIS
jgi:membrane protein implicated in regulation of membrane protease activity